MANLNQRLVLVLRWKGGVLLDKTGRWPLIIFSVPLILAIYWGGVLRPHSQQLQDSLHEMQQQLRSPLNDAPRRLSYAAGSALGRDILSLTEERQRQGIPIERDSLLAGVVDRVSGHLLLSQGELDRLTAQADAMVSQNQEKKLSIQEKRDKAYVAAFRRKKGVRRSDTGFWYRVDYAGKGVAEKDAVIDVVVKESLTDGTVIQDMDLSGKVLSQPLSDYPPLFREAIGYLQNHGSITLAVPPALAYGEAGYPPTIPPGATMVYELRIDNIRKPGAATH